MMLRLSFLALAAVTLLTAGSITSRAAVTVGQLDDFSVDLESWMNVGNFSAGVSRQTAGGPAGASDAYMRMASTGAGQSFSRLVAFNQASGWNGDYLAAGVTKIAMDVNNLGEDPLMLRLAFGTSSAPSAGGEWIVTTAAVSLPAASGWTSIEFPLGAGDFTGAPYLNVIDSVVTLRIFHAETPDTSGIGDPIAAALGVDNVRAVGAAVFIPGDFDHMNGVTGADLAKWREDYGGPGSDADGDLDSDGDDFLIWQRNLGLGMGVPAATAAPEPSGTILALLAAIAATLGPLRQSRTSAPTSNEEAWPLLYRVRQMGRLGHWALLGFHPGTNDRRRLGRHRADVRFQ